MIKLSNKKLMAALLLGLTGFNWSCSNSTEVSEQSQDTVQVAESALKVSKSEFGKLEDGRVVDLYTLTNSKGTEVKITNYGAIVTSLKVADREGKIEDVVLGFDNLEGYLQEGVPYFGAIVGRYGNRIGGGQFVIDGENYQLTVNDGPNHLHGGARGFDKVLWDAQQVDGEEGVGVKLNYLSKDMEEGYPGNFTAEVTYTLTDQDELKIDYKGSTDKATIVNLTNHSYFNLSGNLGEKILDHQVMINADQFVPVNNTLIPTGELRSVEGTPFDFTQPTAVGKRIDEAGNEQLAFGKGYDHCWVVNGEPGNMRLASTVYEPQSGRFMEVFTTEPGIQFYTGNFLDGSLSGKGVTYQHRSGFCLETEHYPDSPNQEAFPPVTLRPGETYSTQTTYKFSVKEQEAGS